MTPADVLAAYRYQPNLERRNHVLKGLQEVAPVTTRPSRRASRAKVTQRRRLAPRSSLTT